MASTAMAESAYLTIAQNLHKMAVRAPMAKSGKGFSKAFMDYLEVIYTPEEAQVAKYLKVPKNIFWSSFDPPSLMTPIQIARVSGLPQAQVNRMLAQMGRKNVIADVRRVIKASGFTWPVKLVSALWVIFKAQGIKEVGRIVASFIATAVKNAREYGVMSFFQFLSMKLYMFPQLPLIINVQHYHLESGPEILEGSKLYKEFFLGDEYSRFYQTSVKGTPMTRTIPIAKALAPEEKILNTEEAHKIIDAASLIALTPCACRARTEKMGIRKCKDQNPVGTCIMLGMAAMTMDGWGWGVKVTKQKAKDYLDDMIDKGLVPITINMEDTTNCLICLCCDCCCSQTEGRVSKKNPTAIAPSNFYPQTNRKLCSYCGTCEERCIFDAIKVDKEKQTWRLNPALCVGCGVCVVGCKEEAVKLYRKERHTPFKTTYELYDQIEKDNSMN